MHSKRNIERSSINRRETRICKKEKKKSQMEIKSLTKFFENDDNYRNSKTINVKM